MYEIARSNADGLSGRLRKVKACFVGVLARLLRASTSLSHVLQRMARACAQLYTRAKKNPLRFSIWVSLCVVVLVLLLAGCGAEAATQPAPTSVPATPTQYSLEMSSTTSMLSTPVPTATAPATVTVAPTRTHVAATPTATVQPSPTAEPIVNLMAVGDLMMDRSVGRRIVQNGPAVPFAGVVDTFAQADIVVANLETAISGRGTPEPKSYTFRSPPAAAQSVGQAGIDLVSLGNNHAFDYGLEAFEDTRSLLAQQGVTTVGAGDTAAEARAPVVIEQNGMRIAFLAYVDVPVESSGFNTRRWEATETEPGVVWAEPAVIATDVQVARESTDVVVVLLHFGYEYQTQPSAKQKEQARTAIDAGAALVVGAHPHVLQPVEEYNGGVIAYSLGNFVFDGFRGKANESAILEATLTQDGVVGWRMIPVQIEAGLPRVVE